MKMYFLETPKAHEDNLERVLMQLGSPKDAYAFEFQEMTYLLVVVNFDLLLEVCSMQAEATNRFVVAEVSMGQSIKGQIQWRTQLNRFEHVRSNAALFRCFRKEMQPLRKNNERERFFLHYHRVLSKLASAEQPNMIVKKYVLNSPIEADVDEQELQAFFDAAERKKDKPDIVSFGKPLTEKDRTRLNLG